MANVKKKPDIDLEKMGNNPFMLNIQIKAKEFDKDEYLIVENSDGVNIPRGIVKNKVLFEDSSSTKIYHDKDFRKIILNLSYNALRLCKFIEYQLKPSEDFIWINNTMFMKETNIRKLSIYQESLEELIRYGVLSPTIYDSVYWTNSLIMFSGNRLRKYPENIKLR